MCIVVHQEPNYLVGIFGKHACVLEYGESLERVVTLVKCLEALESLELLLDLLVFDELFQLLGSTAPENPN